MLSAAILFEAIGAKLLSGLGVGDSRVCLPAVGADSVALRRIGLAVWGLALLVVGEPGTLFSPVGQPHFCSSPDAEREKAPKAQYNDDANQQEEVGAERLRVNLEEHNLVLGKTRLGEPHSQVMYFIFLTDMPGVDGEASITCPLYHGLVRSFISQPYLTRLDFRRSARLSGDPTNKPLCRI